MECKHFCPAQLSALTSKTPYELSRRMGSFTSMSVRRCSHARYVNAYQQREVRRSRFHCRRSLFKSRGWRLIDCSCESLVHRRFPHMLQRLLLLSNHYHTLTVRGNSEDLFGLRLPKLWFLTKHVCGRHDDGPAASFQGFDRGRTHSRLR